MIYSVRGVRRTEGMVPGSESHPGSGPSIIYKLHVSYACFWPCVQSCNGWLDNIYLSELLKGKIMPEKYLADSSISMITDISIDNKIIAEIIFLDQAKYNLEYTQAICAKN